MSAQFTTHEVWLSYRRPGSDTVSHLASRSHRSISIGEALDGVLGVLYRQWGPGCEVVAFRARALDIETGLPIVRLHEMRSPLLDAQELTAMHLQSPPNAEPSTYQGESES